MKKIELELPVAISENSYRRFVHGCNHPIISHAGRKYHEIVKLRFRQSGQQKITGKVKVTIDFYPPDRRKRDLDNQFKCLLDSLVDAGCIEDDSLICWIEAHKYEPYPGGMNHITITSLQD